MSSGLIGVMARGYKPQNGGGADPDFVEPWSGRVSTAPCYPSFGSLGESIPQANLRGKATTPQEGQDFVKESNLTENKSHVQCWPLVSGLLNTAHMLPLHIVNAGIVLELTLARPREVGVWRAATAVASPVETSGLTTATPHVPTELALYTASGSYEVRNVAYVAHIVQLSDEFNSALRNQVNTAGSLTLHGDRYQHFGSSYDNETTNPQINIPARSRSIKAIFSMQRVEDTGGPNSSSNGVHYGQSATNGRDSTGSAFLTSSFTQCNVNAFHYSVGSVQFPTKAITLSAEGRLITDQPYEAEQRGSGCAQAYCELLKCFGTLGSIDHNTSLSSVTYSKTGHNNPGPGDFAKCFAIGYSLDSFSRSVIESGINSSDRALQITLHLQRSGKSVIEPRKCKLCMAQGWDAQHRDADGNIFSSMSAQQYSDQSGSFLYSPAPERIRVDSYVVSDQFFFFNDNGTVTATI